MKSCSSGMDCEGPWKQRQGVFASREPEEHASTQRRDGETVDPPEYNSCHAPWWHHSQMPGDCHNNRWEARMRLSCVNRQEWLRVLVMLQKKDLRICPDPSLSLSTPLGVEKLTLTHFEPNHCVQV